MATIVEPDTPSSRSSKRRKRIGIAAAILAPLLILLGLACITQWFLSHLFTQPPASVDKPPLLSDAQNVKVQQTDKSDGKITTYETMTDPDAVYRFYEDALVKDGWGGLGYFSKPQLTSQGLMLEWDQSGINGCEELGYTLHIVAEKT